MSRTELDVAITKWCRPESEGGLPGWCTLEKAKWLAANIIGEDLIHVVELGVFGGRSLLPMGGAVRLVNRGGFVLGIDSYCVEKQIEGMSYTAHVEWGKTIDFDRFHGIASAAIREAGLQSHCGIVRASSDEVACLVGTLDLLHIDACHSILAACRDVETWVPKVRSGGLIVLDDAEWESVQPARSMLNSMCGKPGYTSDGWEVYRKK